MIFRLPNIFLYISKYSKLVYTKIHSFFSLNHYSGYSMIIMGKIKKLELTAEQYTALEHGFRNGTSHCFRMRCRAVILKGKGQSLAKAGDQTEMSFVSVNAWVKRFLTEGIDGLETRPGRGRKPIMDCSDEQAVRLAIEQDRQSVSKAKQTWQQATGKRASDITFKRFLSALAQDISV